MRCYSADIPFDGQVLYFSVGIAKCLDNTIDCSSRGIIIVVEEVWSADSENFEQIVQGHEPIVGISVV